jgi:uncharacterized protein (DUF934 family)
MTDATTPDARRLWTPGGFRLDDPWRRVDPADGAAVPGHAILSLTAWRNRGPEIDALNAVGVEIAAGEPLDAIVDDIHRFGVIVLAFPKFSDGRSYSKAVLLRERHRYTGLLRAGGDVLIDQVPHMLRAGFDEFEVENPFTIARLEAGRLGGLPVHYQPSVREAAGERYSWRRLGA